MSSEPATTAAPTSTTEPTETSATVPDVHSEKPSESTAQTPTTPALGVADLAVKEEAASTVSPALEKLWTATQPLLSSIHPEIWGVTLAEPSSHVPSQIVLQKYLNANDQDHAKALDQLTKTLEWRAKMKPLQLLERKFNKVKFGGLGFVTTYSGGEGKAEEVFTWNIYGGVKSVDETFGNLEEFIAWRVALMELALQSLSLASATTPLAANPDTDPYKITQVHDYRSISFLRQSAAVKSASSETIKVFAQNYPELLKEKFFVNVPVVMGFIYELIKRFVAERTRKRFHPMSNGAGLAKEFGGSKVEKLGEMLPAEYGGKGKALVEVGKEPLLEE